MPRPDIGRSTSPELTGLFAAGPFALGVFIIAGLLGMRSQNELSWGVEATSVMYATFVVAPGAYIYGVLNRPASDRTARPLAAVANIAALLLGSLMLSYLIVPVLQKAFMGYVFTPFWGAVFLAGYAFILAYTLAALGARMWIGDTVTFAVVVVGLAIVASAVGSGADDWWKGAISSLGTGASDTAGLFSAACIVAGAMLILSAPSMKEPLARCIECGLATPRATRWFPGIMVFLGVLLSLVGLFPMDGGDIQFQIHNDSGIIFGVTIVACMVFAWAAFPGMPNRFFWYSWVFAALGAISVPLYIPLHAFSLAEVEVIAFSLSGIWTVMLFAIMKDLGAYAPAERSGTP